MEQISIENITADSADDYIALIDPGCMKLILAGTYANGQPLSRARIRANQAKYQLNLAVEADAVHDELSHAAITPLDLANIESKVSVQELADEQNRQIIKNRINKLSRAYRLVKYASSAIVASMATGVGYFYADNIDNLARTEAERNVAYELFEYGVVAFSGLAAMIAISECLSVDKYEFSRTKAKEAIGNS